jgi:hypothetical protein
MPLGRRPFSTANYGKSRRSATIRRSTPTPECHFGAGAHPDAILFPMADKDKASGMKSAYELALERLEKQGIERPREESFGDELREKIAEARRRAEARLAELEILHKNRLKTQYDPAKRQEEEEEYVRERRRIEDERDRKVEELRKG